MIQKKFFVDKLSFRRLKYVAVLAVALPFVSCNGGSDEVELVGNWVKRSTLDGRARQEAVAAVVGDYAYVGSGYNSEEDERLNDFWKYEPLDNQWTRIADFPGVARTGAVAFSAAGKLYVGTGYDGSNRLNDFWQYDPATEQWSPVAPFPGTARYGAIAFSINNIGYVGTGYDGGYMKDFYAYNPVTNTWSAVQGFSGEKRREAVTFVIDGKAYVCCGENSGLYESDFYSFDPATGWVQLSKIANVSDDKFDDDYSIVRNKAVAFAANGKGYVCTSGRNTNGVDVWEYNPATDRWIEKKEFEGSSRMNAVAFSISDKGFVGLGNNGSFNFDDLWRFDPDAEFNEFD